MKPFTCEICGQSFARRERLKHHLERNHQGVLASSNSVAVESHHSNMASPLMTPSPQASASSLPQNLVLSGGLSHDHLLQSQHQEEQVIRVHWNIFVPCTRKMVDQCLECKPKWWMLYWKVPLLVFFHWKKIFLKDKKTNVVKYFLKEVSHCGLLHLANLPKNILKFTAVHFLYNLLVVPNKQCTRLERLAWD